MSEIRNQARTMDRRVRRTRAALRDAFNALLLSPGYDSLSAADVAEQANVGRSTFYEHFQSKEDLLAQSLVPMLEPLAEAIARHDADTRLVAAVEHFWENRRLASALMSGRARLVMVGQLSSLIEAQLKAIPADCAVGRLRLPSALEAVRLAHGQLALIEAWLSGRHGCTARQIADALSE